MRLPGDAAKGNWQVELGIVIGTAGMYVDEADADRHMAGRCLFNALTERSYQMERGGQWTKGKSLPGDTIRLGIDGPGVQEQRIAGWEG